MNRALLVGINNYPPPNELSGCVNDVTDMANFLVAKCGFGPDEIRLLTDARATAQNILGHVGWLLTGISPGDRLFFHYSGHGAQVATRNPQGETDGVDDVICPVDFNFDDDDTMIRDKDFARIFRPVPVGVEFVWVSDSCFSGGLMKAIAVQHVKSKTLVLPADIAWRNAAARAKKMVPLGMKGAADQLNLALISGCSALEESSDAEINGRYNGALTYFLLQTLEGQDGLKTPLTQLVNTVSRDLEQAHFTQHPELHGSDEIEKKPFLATWVPIRGETKPAEEASDEQFIKERIYHDAWAGEAGERAMGISIPDTVWPAGLKPVPDNQHHQYMDSPVPKVDIMVVTYTIDETRAISYVFTGDPEYETSWSQYGHNFDGIRPKITDGLTDRNGNPTKLSEGTMSYVCQLKVKDRNVLLVKSEMHPAVNGPALPFIDLVEQLVKEAQPELLITSGTAGAIGSRLNIGDVVIANSALFHCKKTYPDYVSEIPTVSTGATQTPLSSSVAVRTDQIEHANNNMTKLIVPGLLGDVAKLKSLDVGFVTANQSPQIYFEQVPGAKAMNVVSADYFSVDDSNDTEKLQELGIMDDMDDAFVALAVRKSGMEGHTAWLSVRNASEPQLPSDSRADQAKAIKTYKTCGFHTSINGAFACWAVICGFEAH